MTKFFAKIALAAALTVPVGASALTVNFYDSAVGGSVVHTATDEGAGDFVVGQVGILSTSAPSVGGYSFAGDFSAISNYPPVDSMSSTFTVGLGGAGASARVEVSHFFDNGVPTPLTGLGQVSNNLLGFAGSLVTTEVYIASTLFGTDQLVASTSGAGTGDSGLEILASTPYYITQIFTIAGENSSISTATAEWTVPAPTTPVPLPAAGGMLLTVMIAGGIAARRKKKAA